MRSFQGLSFRQAGRFSVCALTSLIRPGGRGQIDRLSRGQKNGESRPPPSGLRRFSVPVQAPRFIQKPRFVAILLFLGALLPRLPGLSRFLTSDENTNIFFAGSDVIVAFLAGDFRGTYWHFYPGVTMSWLDAAGMAGQYWLERLSGAAVPPFTAYVYRDILSLLTANRLPYAILTAAAVPAVYLLGRKLLPERVAVVGALLLAFDPFYLAHSRVAHGDAPVAVFMSLSALAFFVYANQVSSLPGPVGGGRPTPSPGRSLTQVVANPYLLLSAFCGGLAALTKAPGQFMALFVGGLSFLYMVSIKLAFKRGRDGGGVGPWVAGVAAWGGVSLVVFVLLWPSMWVDPLGTIAQMLQETFGKANEGHLVYFFGRPTLDPGPWFYLYVIPFRLTPVVLIGVLLSWLYFLPGLRRNAPHLNYPPVKSNDPPFSSLFLLWFFFLTLLLFANLSPKKQDRYLLPLFPILDLIAAIGWLGLFDLIRRLFQSQLSRLSSESRVKNNTSNYQLPDTGYHLLAAALLILHLIPIFTYYPYYLTYFNPLMGGPDRAAETTLMGWGEGMEQAAAYLNAKPDAENLSVASTPSQTLLPYFAGTGENFYTNDIAFRSDYVVLYLAQRQRLAPSPEIVRYFEAQEPEAVITIQGVPYAKIYPGPKRILPDIPAGATPANIGLDQTIRLAGYEISSLLTGDRPRPEALPGLTGDGRAEVGDRPRPEALPTSSSGLAPSPSHLTLYWHTLAPLATNYTISVRAYAADGRLLAQQDRWPVGGLLPTSQWRQGDYVADSYSLDFAEDERAAVSRYEIVVYNAETGETLGPPITLPLAEAGNG